jgi:hypothetical protein
VDRQRAREGVDGGEQPLLALPRPVPRSAALAGLLALATCKGPCASTEAPVVTVAPGPPASPPPPAPTAPAPTASALPPAPPPAGSGSLARRPSLPPRRGWPLIPYCAVEACTTATGERGVSYPRGPGPGTDARCKPQGQCFNPCPVGMAPNPQATFCERVCKGDAECEGGSCVKGLCESMERPSTADWQLQGECRTADGRDGFHVRGDNHCYPWCKVGLVLYGGTHCVKPCASSADCPGGQCAREESPPLCGPLCPSEGCPYPWE